MKSISIGDFSNGNDAIVLKEHSTLADIKGQKVNLVKLSVSHYLLARGLESVGLKENIKLRFNESFMNLAAEGKL